MIDRRFSDEEKKVVEGYELVLDGLVGEQWRQDPHMKDTPRRVAAAMLDELCAGLSADMPKMTTFPLEGEPTMIISRHIPVRSLCAHHLLPFTGEATVAYIPRGRVLGLSKLSRAVDYMARKPQVQEKLTSDIADLLVRILAWKPQLNVNADGGEEGAVMYEADLKKIEIRRLDMDGWGVAVVVRSRHMCMELRGVQHSSDVITSALRGEFNKPEVRAEFLSLAEVNGK